MVLVRYGLLDGHDCPCYSMSPQMATCPTQECVRHKSGAGPRREPDRAVPVRARARRCAGRTACHWRSRLSFLPSHTLATSERLSLLASVLRRAPVGECLADLVGVGIFDLLVDL